MKLETRLKGELHATTAGWISGRVALTKVGLTPLSWILTPRRLPAVIRERARCRA